MNIYRQTSTIKRILLLLAIILIIALLWYSQQIVDKLREDLNNQISFYAGVYARAAVEESEQDFSFIFDEIIRKSTIPMIISAELDKHPTAWRNVGIEDLDLNPETVKKLEQIMAEMDSANDPIPLTYKNYDLGYIHYGDTKLIRQLVMLPYIEITVVALFIFLGYMGFQVIRSSEKRSIWVGMAKETAHQLGTPLTSLMGWVELLQSDYPENENIAEMARDIRRLEKITNRFSRIGSTPAAEKVSINATIQEAVDYYLRRLPQLGPGIQVKFEPSTDYQVTIIRDLFAWAIENLIKNAIDAVPQKNGKIRIQTGLTKNGKWLAIDFIDNGKGILSKDRKNIFRPGYSTKKRGWGLGLSLTKRIITDYHRGKISVVESRPKEKTTLRILIKTG
ncbi:MAG TPA: HAMP domain-containing histidine kinase [Candidatus Marinimicrobia bacterium]|nr:HAMP domain-containing histidine kinase [Candidatus Neomarinimicrobiota bacterium]